MKAASQALVSFSPIAPASSRAVPAAGQRPPAQVSSWPKPAVLLASAGATVEVALLVATLTSPGSSVHDFLFLRS